MALFQTILLIYHLPACYSNLGKRLVKTAKLVMSDTGLLATLLAVDAAGLKNTPLFGAVIENFVIAELKKQISMSNTRPALLHYRTHTGQEVDVVLEDTAERIVGIEIKSTKSVGGQNFHKGVVLYGGSEIVSFGSNLCAMPIGSLWSRNYSAFAPVTF